MERFKTYVHMLNDLGAPIRLGAKLLDFGCGSGTLVKSAYQSGIDAYGCDITFDSEWVDQQVLADMRAQNRVRAIETPYRLPFDDATFDVVISDQVFEHVQNYGESIAELHRVMKSGGVFLHLFPSRYIPIEPHIFVPFASFFHPRWWLAIWAALGIRNQYQRDLSVTEAIESNENFMRSMTNYLSQRELMHEFSKGFRTRSVERQFMKISKRAKLFLLPALYRAFWQRCIFGVKL